MRVLLLFLHLMEAVVVSSQSFADTYPCSHNLTRRGVLHFAEKTPFAICCHLGDTYCNKTTFNDTLTLLPENENASLKMYREDLCLVRFEVENASSVDERDYECKWNSEVLTIDKVHIIEKPQPPVIISFSCSQNNNLTVTFDRGVPSTVYMDKYVVTMIDSKKTITLCNNISSMCKPNEQICTCTYWNPADTIPVPSMEVTIIVNVSRSVQFSETRRNYFIAASILPGPVKRLKVKDVSPYDANIQFCMHKDTMNLFGFMHSYGASLQFHLWVFTVQGVPEILNVTLPSKEEECSYCSNNRCMLVHLSNLTALTNYTVVVSDSGGGGESQKRKLEFTTSQTEPAQPPEVDEFSFIRWDNVTVNGNLTSGLILMWKPVPHEVKGGREFSYHVEVTTKKGFNVNQTTIETYAIWNTDLPPGPLKARIWSQNVIGKSRSYTLLDIPPKSDSKVPYVTVELNENKAVVYVNLTQLESNLTILWCSSYTFNKKVPVCQKYPQIANYPILAGLKVQKFEIELNPNKIDESREMINNRIIEYYHLEYLNSTPGNKYLANANVTTYPNGIQAIEDYDFYNDDSMHDSNDYYYYEYNLRRKRDVQNSWMGKMQSMNQLQTQVSQVSEATPQVFISMKMEDSLWNSGMIPANCYYDRKKGEVSLIVSQHRDDSDNTVILQWKQVCDEVTPVQFLADYFRVFSSKNEICSEAEAAISDKISNSIFQPNIMKLVEHIEFVCIHACKSDGECQFAKPQQVMKLEGIKLQQTNYTVPLAVGLPIGVVAVLLFAVLLHFKCRKPQVEKKTGKDPIKLPENTNIENPLYPEKDSDPPDVPERNITKLHNNFNNSSDSGRGTDLCFTDSKNLKNTDNKDISPGIHGAITFNNSPHEHWSVNDTNNTQNNDTGSVVRLEKHGSIDDREENNDTDNESKNDTGRSDDSDQKQFLEKLNLNFNDTNTSRSSQSLDNSGSTSDIDGVAIYGQWNEIPDHSIGSMEGGIHTSPDVESMCENFSQHQRDPVVFLRMSSESDSDGDLENQRDQLIFLRMSSESESDGDSKKALISQKDRH